MSEQEIEKLKAEVLATHKKEIDQYKKDDEQVEYCFSESWSFSGVFDLLHLSSVRGFAVSLFRLASKPRIIFVVLIAALTFETLHFHPIIESTRPQIVSEYSHFDGWREQAAKNEHTPLIHHFIEMPKTQPHVPEVEFQGAPVAPMYAQLTGFSPSVTGQYYQ